MGQDLTGNLKDLKVEGNLLADRFRSMQKRNILAPTKKQIRKKPKVKKYTKPGHKEEDWKKTVALHISNWHTSRKNVNFDFLLWPKYSFIGYLQPEGTTGANAMRNLKSHPWLSPSMLSSKNTVLVLKELKVLSKQNL
ncbi:hypothetical protein NQ317_003666 [Molorchus minor]|uniref:Ribosome biogenesis protein NOP53 n=1 Tax=Molorchus minor TaxID=1323400 RepID=A0ABQ9JNT0_9CUCU|nr:hypothetical protein NQ317_003666 [Molorchus minor]